jgi:hypothetical protein
MTHVVAEYDSHLMAQNPSLHQKWVDYVTALGLDPYRIQPRVAITTSRDGADCELHGTHWGTSTDNLDYHEGRPTALAFTMPVEPHSWPTQSEEPA